MSKFFSIIVLIAWSLLVVVPSVEALETPTTEIIASADETTTTTTTVDEEVTEEDSTTEPTTIYYPGTEDTATEY